jgi:hypothetical protein
MITVRNHALMLDSYEPLVRLMVAACAEQLRAHLAPAWGRVPEDVVYASDIQVASPHETLLALLDDPDQANALGYHSLSPDGRPYGRVFVRPVMEAGGTLLTGELSVSAVLSHECMEWFIDPDVNLWADNPSDGYSYALEVGDPVEGDSYAIGTDAEQVSVSNFVTPAFFSNSPPKGVAFDHMGKLTAPFTMTPNGYMVRFRDSRAEQIFASRLPAWRAAGKEFASARTARRLTVQS